MTSPFMNQFILYDVDGNVRNTVNHVLSAKKVYDDDGEIKAFQVVNDDGFYYLKIEDGMTWLFREGIRDVSRKEVENDD